MRFLLLTFLSVLVVSCSDSGSSAGSKNPLTPTRQPQENVPAVEVGVDEVNEIDLLDVAMDVPVQISGNQIIFKQSVANMANGVNAGSTCNFAVAAGEIYNYQLDGSTLSLRKPSGENLVFSRVSGNEASIVGSWTGKTTVGNQLRLQRMTFLGENRVVVRTHCEG